MILNLWGEGDSVSYIDSALVTTACTLSASTRPSVKPELENSPGGTYCACRAWDGPEEKLQSESEGGAGGDGDPTDLGGGGGIDWAGAKLA